MNQGGLAEACKALADYKGEGGFDLREREGGGVTGTSPIIQILRIRAESQQIVAARPLYCLQYPIRIKSSAKDLPQRTSAILMKVCYRAEAYT